MVSVPITIKLTNDADDPNSTIVGADGGKIYIKTGRAAHGTGELWYNGQELALENVSNVTDLTDGKYYVISGVSYGSDIELFYKPDTHTSGALQLTTYVVTQETGASEKLSTQTGSFSITPENSGYNIGPIEATGSENQAHVAGDGKIPLPLPVGHGLVDSDGSEEIVSVTLSGVPTDYIVYIGNEVAQNVGGGAWSIKLTEDGKIPGNISILPKEYDSGTYNLSLNIFTKETERNDIEEDNVTITLKSIRWRALESTTKTFGETGSQSP